MGIFNIFNKKKQKSTDPRYNELIFGRFGVSPFIKQEPTKETYIKEGFQKNATVYSIVDLISKSASNIKMKVYEKVDGSAAKEYNTLISGALNDNAMFKAERAKKRAYKPADNSDLAKFLENPNPKQGQAEFLADLIAFESLTGDGFIWGLKPESGNQRNRIKEMHVLPSQLVEIVGGDIMDPIKGYTLNWLSYNKSIPSQDVAHIKNFNPDYSTAGSHLYGQSPLQPLFRNLSINNNAIQTGSKYLTNQGARGILSSQDNMLTAEHAATLRDKYKSMYSGVDNAGEIMVTNHDFKWIEMGLPLADLALIEQYNLSIKDLASAYKVPSILLNDTQSSTFNNYREGKKAFYLQAVFPKLIAVRDELNRWLTPTYGSQYYIDFDFLSVPELQEDMEKVVRQLSLAWWLTPNEKRAVMQYEPIEQKEMDEIHMLANYIPISDGVTPKESGGSSQQLLNDTSDYDKK
jgi:HK97 family phage portal protein